MSASNLKVQNGQINSHVIVSGDVFKFLLWPGQFVESVSVSF